MEKGNVDSSYEFPEHEKTFVHLRLETPDYDSRTGAKLSTPFIQKFTEKEFKQTVEIAGFAQYKVQILHDPSKGLILKDVNQEYVAKDASTPIHLQGSGVGTISNEATPETKTFENDGSNPAPTAPVVVWDKGFKKADYQDKYTEIYGEAPNEDLKIEDLKEAIQVKLDEQE